MSGICVQLPIACMPLKLPVALASTLAPVDSSCEIHAEHVIDGDTLAQRLERRRLVDGRSDTLLLDYRLMERYDDGYIAGALHVTLPTILYKRLLNGQTSPLMSIGRSNRDDEDASAFRLWLTTNARDLTLVIITDAIMMCDEQRVDAVTRLLVDKFDALHFGVKVLQGGYAHFATTHPHLCVLPLPIDSLSIDDEDEMRADQRLCGNENAACCSRDAEQATSPKSPLQGQSKYHPYGRRSLKSINAQFPFKILDYLYLGNAQNSADRAVLDRHGIRYIINVTPDVANTFESDARFHYYQISIPDNHAHAAVLASHFDECCAFIDKARLANEAVLVHCLAGISRSVTVTVAYIMRHMHKDLDSAFEYVQKLKPNISPNFNFMGTLVEWERSLHLVPSEGSPDSGQYSGGDEILPDSGHPVLLLAKPPQGRKNKLAKT